MTEVTDSWQHVVRTAEQEWPRWREAAGSAAYPADCDALDVAARRLRAQDFTDSGPPGIVARYH